ncbi:hypothetical protein ACJZQ5_000310 [Enterococcus hirae]|uniref:Uncharacterized protein n=2 Tax=Enterococcus hirae TaxID=1354 RepID=I6T7L2_ENTHA|nr:hypothetical protein [Enterococcus hirae]AFM69154.1 hypothetical protein EHR_00800 [Enterococcus hirae ATCC 9790]EMF0052937.1 hypothetical protein [Enterococcus hirae]EMF0102271.1 hypothetical protein [Enterococcus hirae]EMF0137239.1 hypothetical protein [Enterococcus hirae]EMF0406352.1 hypothetical protein [Enterococcus hirae]
MEEYAEKQKEILDIKVNILKKAEKAMEDAVKEENSAMVAAIAELLKNY